MLLNMKIFQQKTEDIPTVLGTTWPYKPMMILPADNQEKEFKFKQME